MAVLLWYTPCAQISLFCYCFGATLTADWSHGLSIGCMQCRLIHSGHCDVVVWAWTCKAQYVLFVHLCNTVAMFFCLPHRLQYTTAICNLLHI